MTKEELEKEAEKNILNLKNNSIKVSGKPFQINNGDYIQGYLDGAEPREKRIAELKDRNQELLESCEGATMMYKDLCKAKEIIAKQEAQIEKMKNWCNCKNYQQCLIELAEQGKGMKPSECCVNCKKWEIKEK